MSLRIEEEDLLPLSAASSLLPGNPTSGTIARWALKGVGTERVRLESILVGGRRFTSRQAIARFIAARSQRIYSIVSDTERSADADQYLKHEWTNGAGSD